jgi:NAD(P)H-flavin reductase
MTAAAAPRVPATGYVPLPVPIAEVRNLTERERWFRIALPSPLGHKPGQFVMVSVLGVGEAPISISCGPDSGYDLELVIRRVGGLTGVLHGLGPGDAIGLRGPFGLGFELAELRGKDLVFVCGGLGLVPLRSLIEPVVADKDRFGKVTIISGCRSPSDELYRDRLKAWADRPGVEVIRLVDDPQHMPWDHEVGLVTAPLRRLKLDPANTWAALCGPPVMYKFVLLELAAHGIPNEHIFVDLERRMRCGVGKCGHCQIGPVYCCQDGPVVRVSKLVALKEALR